MHHAGDIPDHDSIRSLAHGRRLGAAGALAALREGQRNAADGSRRDDRR